jgi:hypothetical protein
VVVANDHDLSFMHHGVIVDVQASRCERTLLLEMGASLFGEGWPTGPQTRAVQASACR